MYFFGLEVHCVLCILSYNTSSFFFWWGENTPDESDCVFPLQVSPFKLLCAALPLATHYWSFNYIVHLDRTLQITAKAAFSVFCINTGHLGHLQVSASSIKHCPISGTNSLPHRLSTGNQVSSDFQLQFIWIRMQYSWILSTYIIFLR